jgi:hypothetical protein
MFHIIKIKPFINFFFKLLHMFKILKNVKYTKSYFLKESNLKEKIKSYSNIQLRFFSNQTEETKNKEKYIYIMSDKYNVKPDKEIRIIKSEDQEIEGAYSYTKKISHYNQVNLFKYKEFKQYLRKTILRVFFPRNYPSSVRSGYYHFTKHAFLNSIFYYIMNFISTQVLINSLGMNFSKPLSLGISAGLNWVVKDGIGQLGGIAFNAKYCNSIENNLREWRVISFFMYNFGILLEICTILRPQNFLLIASCATLCKFHIYIKF